MKTELLSPTPEALSRAGQLLRGGEVVGFPTETVYGLGANALDALAVEKIFAAKGRPGDNPLIVHIAAAEDSLTALAEGEGFLLWQGEVDAVPDGDISSATLAANALSLLMLAVLFSLGFLWGRRRR